MMINRIHPANLQNTSGYKICKPGEIGRFVNACNPWNKGAGTTINNWFLGITEAEMIGSDGTETAPGTIIACNREEGLIVKTIDNQKIRLNIIYTNEGFFSGSRLAAFDIKPGMKFI